MGSDRLTYALVTPARNEEALIGQTIESVVSQTVRPIRWIIVSDGSTDGTDQIVDRHTAQYEWIELMRMPQRRDRQFGGKAIAFNAGYERLKPLTFDLIGNLDADITFEPDYYEFLTGRFSLDPNLGVAGTPFVEDFSQPAKHTYAHRHADLRHVSGACQMFRSACFEAVGGYVPIKGGAVDWVAVTTARMKGWRTQTFPEKVCFHHRKIGTGNNSPLAVHFHYGKKAYYIGGHPLWAIARGTFEMRKRPWILGGLLYQFGFFWGMVTQIPRPVSSELMAFHRAEQLSRLKRLFGIKSGPKQHGHAPLTGG